MRQYYKSTQSTGGRHLGPRGVFRQHRLCMKKCWNRASLTMPSTYSYLARVGVGGYTRATLDMSSRFSSCSRTGAQRRGGGCAPPNSQPQGGASRPLLRGLDDECEERKGGGEEKRRGGRSEEEREEDRTRIGRRTLGRRIGEG